MSVAQLARRAAKSEAGVWRSLYLVMFRRPRVPAPDAHGFGYASPAAPMIWIFIGVSAVEVVAFHLIVPWEIVRISGLVVGIWGLLWMLGLLASLYSHPHVVDADGVRVRYGNSVDIHIPWDAIDTIQLRKRDLPSSRKVQKTDDGVVNVGVASQVNVRIVLSEPTELPLPNGTELCTEVGFYAEDPMALIASAREVVNRM